GGSDPVATRVLTKGEAIPAPSGRADDFSWPRGGIAASDPSLADTPPTPAVLATPDQPAPPSQPTSRQNASGQNAAGQPKGQSAPGSKSGEQPKQPAQRRSVTPSFFDNFPRPPGAIRPSASTQGAIR